MRGVHGCLNIAAIVNNASGISTQPLTDHPFRLAVRRGVPTAATQRAENPLTLTPVTLNNEFLNVADQIISYKGSCDRLVGEE